ncbi:MAG: hypothetical protein HGN29_09765 [Asgard group archaeon]|nr:hypothetical protein [Asgard group archaeon]
MNLEESKLVTQKDKQSRLKKKIKILVIALIILSAVFIPTAFIILFTVPFDAALTIYVILIGFIYIPIGGVMVITTDIFIWLYIHEKFETKDYIGFNIFENKRVILSIIILTIISCWLASVIIDIRILISPEEFFDLTITSDYVFLSGIVLLACFIYILGINVKEIKKASTTSSLLLFFYCIIKIPHFSEIFLRRLRGFLPFTFVVYSLLIFGTILIFYILKKVTNSKIIYLILGFGWVLVLIDIIYYVSVYFAIVRWQGYHVIFLFEISLIILSILVFVISLIHILFILLFKREKKLSPSLESQVLNT